MTTAIWKKFYGIIIPSLREGDTLAWRGTRLIAKGIAWADDAYYTHTDGIVYRDPKSYQWRVIRSWHNGVEDIPLSRAFADYNSDGADVCIIRPLVKPEIHKKRLEWLKDQVGNNKGYDHKLLLLHLLYLKGNRFLSKFGVRLSETFLYKFDNENKYVCSELFQWSIIEVGISDYSEDKLLTPNDAVIKAGENIAILYNDYKKK